MKNKYIVDDDVVFIELTHKDLGVVYTKIDYTDFSKVNEIGTTWHVSLKNKRIDGVKTKKQLHKKRKVIWLHRLITNPSPTEVVDHINGDTLNNRRYNLRILTPAQNATNLSSLSKGASGHTNIYFEKGKFGVRIHNKRYGRYNTIEEAINVRDKIIKNIFPLRER